MDQDKKLIPAPTNQSIRGMYVGENVAIISTFRKDSEPIVDRMTDPDGLDKVAAPFDWVEWGINDNYPDIVDDQNSKEPVSSRCLNFKTKAAIGQGLFWYKKEYIDGKEYHTPVDINAYPDIKAFCEASNIDQTLWGSALDFEWWHLCHTEMITNVTKTKFVKMSRIDTAFCRAAARNAKGRIPKIYISSRFGNKTNVLKKDVTSVDSLDPDNPLAKAKSIYRHGFMTNRRLYYPKPSWHSVFSWVDTMLEVSQWISSNLKNSKNIKYLIKVPWNYFLSLHPRESYKDELEWIAAIKASEEALYTSMDETLAGSSGVNKSFHTKYGKDANGDVIEGFEIIPLENTTNHEAFLPAYDTGAAAICSGHGVPPVLANILVSSSMGASSGSSMREQFNFYMQFETTMSRQTILEPLLLVKKVNKWPADIYPGFRNIILETLDNNKSGTRTEGEGNPTTANKES